MTQQSVTQIDDAVMQLTNGLLALTHVLAQVNPDLTKGFLGMAMHGSVQAGNGDSILKAIWEKAFPGALLPVALSPKEFTKRFGGSNS
ncbi:hypothetical protein C9383_24720 [Pseudomonas palleroniana]|uniref:Uncharacterized protein n=1 Tax=Pseudomonas palleroniana TaxID=191390 RepID=A0A2T4FFA7_9PSED|nr:hypothetical protein [Pseudomonas palleroniana]PTC22113.1 hypothetical protein C9383_24720 [Pseudomonas palleroniana]